jgi:Dehydrogenases with different specificities (related to short-chain alcohol dehydrogenases)
VRRHVSALNPGRVAHSKFSASFGFNDKQRSSDKGRTKMNNRKLNGKVAVVTGGSKGIGAGIAKQFATEGAAVVVNYASDKQGADRVVDEITKRGGKAVSVQANVTNRSEVGRLFAAAEKAFGKIDVLVNNAGVYQFAPLEQVTEDEFHRQFNTNVLGLILATQEAIKHFRPGGGSVVNVSSVASTATPPAAAVYAGAKAAVDAITGVLAKELGPKKIRVNAINPGPVETEGFQGGGFSGSDFEKQAIAQTPLGRIGQPGEIASVAVFLASSDSAWVTGETIRVTGGLR